jgi:hypothetical protein
MAASSSQTTTGILPITVIDGGSTARTTAAGVAFEQATDTITLRSLEKPVMDVPIRVETLVFSDKLTSFLVASIGGDMVEFQGSLVNSRMVIVAPSPAAKRVARAEMNLVLAAAMTSLGKDNRIVLTQLQGVVLDLR